MHMTQILSKGFIKTLSLVVMFSLLTPSYSAVLATESSPSDETANTSEHVNHESENSLGDNHSHNDKDKDRSKWDDKGDHNDDGHPDNGQGGHGHGEHGGHGGHGENEGTDGEEEPVGQGGDNEGVSTVTSCYVGPITLRAASGTNQVVLSWTRVGTSTASFTLERANGTGAFTTIASPTGSDTTYTDSDISANQTYNYRISRDGIYSNLVNVITKEGGDTTLITAPLNLTGNVVDSVSTDLSWDEGWPYATQPEGFLIQRSGTDGIFSQIVTTPFSQTYYDDETLLQNSSYFYRVAAYTGASTSPFTNLVNLVTWRADDLDGNGIIEVTAGEPCPEGYGATTVPAITDNGGNTGGTGTTTDNSGNNNGTGGTTDNSTTTPASNNGGGNTTGQSFGGSGGTGYSGGGYLISSTTGQVLGASTGPDSCATEYLKDYIHLGWDNDPYQVALLQIFLNKEMNAGLPLTGFYDATTMGTVDSFQIKYYEEVLRPWVIHGLPTEKTPTGFVYKTTKRKINNLMCPSLNLPIPQLP